MSYTVYVLKCADGSLYTGITTDLPRRFKEHLARKGGAYTRAHAVRKILFRENMPDRGAALRREAEIKSWSRAKKMLFIKSTRKGGHHSP